MSLCDLQNQRIRRFGIKQAQIVGHRAAEAGCGKRLRQKAVEGISEGIPEHQQCAGSHFAFGLDSLILGRTNGTRIGKAPFAIRFILEIQPGSGRIEHLIQIGLMVPHGTIGRRLPRGHRPIQRLQNGIVCQGCAKLIPVGIQGMIELDYLPMRLHHGAQIDRRNLCGLQRRKQVVIVRRFLGAACPRRHIGRVNRVFIRNRDKEKAHAAAFGLLADQRKGMCGSPELSGRQAVAPHKIIQRFCKIQPALASEKHLWGRRFVKDFRLDSRIACDQLLPKPEAIPDVSRCIAEHRSIERASWFRQLRRLGKNLIGRRRRRAKDQKPDCRRKCQQKEDPDKQKRFNFFQASSLLRTGNR